jgi:hypothetical protein
MGRRVFISAVTKELGSYRAIVERGVLKKGNCEPVTQELMPLSDESIAEKLREAIASCDAAICLVGRKFGACPRSPIAGYEGRSWTQLEYLFSRESRHESLGRSIPVYVFVAGHDAPIDHDFPEEPHLAEAQRVFRDECTGDRDYREFSNADQLRAEISELEFPWDQRKRKVGLSGLWVMALVVGVAVVTLLLPSLLRKPVERGEPKQAGEPVPRSSQAKAVDDRPSPPVETSKATRVDREWAQVNLAVALRETDEARRRIPKCLSDTIVNGPFYATGAADRQRIEELRNRRMYEPVHGELLFVSELAEARPESFRLEFQGLRETALLCEWYPADGEPLPLRTKRVLFPDPVSGTIDEAFEFMVSEGSNTQRGWLGIWAFPLAVEAETQLAGDEVFRAPRQDMLTVVVPTPWRLGLTAGGG